MAQATVVFSICIDLDQYDIVIDESRRDDSEYIEDIKEKIKDAAAEVINTNSIDAEIKDCKEYPELLD